MHPMCMQVAYVPRSSIPRLSRQAVSDVLLGRYLSLLLEGCGVNSCGDSESLKQVGGSKTTYYVCMDAYE